MGDRKAFFYGTLMVPKVLYRVCYGDENADKNPLYDFHTKSLTFQPAILHDFSRRRVRYADYPGIIPQKGHTIRGTFVTGLTDGDIYRLNTFEGEQYKLKKVRVELLVEGRVEKPDEENVMADAEVYVWSDYEEHLEDREWDFEEFRREKLHRWVDSSTEYEDLDKLEETPGPDSKHAGV
ncbi:hypothetical protein G7Y89_g11678 [Cudoniella acicularis]|uniref:Putative gamma-glutamylcyclotransferase n=1 Tax=Cudoniella acicularis TaxID=354080 RepID=A0A8H4RAF1_9HELO|nr:hypothetical protein G7Y89_g11678 [Cudoniella acicularis]